MLFDNGNLKNPQLSRALEIKIDTSDFHAEKVWEYFHPSQYYASFLGSVQRLANGNTLINWSGYGTPFASEVTPTGETVYEAIGRTDNQTYRSYRFEWEGMALRPYLLLEYLPDKVILIFNKFGDTDIDHYKIYTGESEEQLAPAVTTSLTTFEFSQLAGNRRHYFMVTAVDPDGIESPPSNIASVYVRSLVPGQNMIHNGEFSNNFDPWSIQLGSNAQATGKVNDGYFQLNIQNPGTKLSDVQLVQGNLPLYINQEYTIEFDAWASQPRAIEVKMTQNDQDAVNYSKTGLTYVMTKRRTYRYTFIMQDQTDMDAFFAVQCGEQSGDVMLDNISLKTSLTDFAEFIEENLNNLQLVQNFPNPFNPVTSIEYSIPHPQHVTVIVYDISGRVVAKLVDRFQNSGRHKIFFDGNLLASGVYYCRLKTADLTLMKKMCLLK
ncbi:carbohydrate binding domain-containing protein [candidate division KSB1 bacterium]|nr:carbohydrate binding domain-containing protein [candidate division KSB1 bacterium]